STNMNSSLDALTNAVGRIRSGVLYPGYLELRHFVRPGFARVLWMEPGPAASGNPGSAVSWEDFAAEVETNRVALEEVRQALRDPAPHAGSHNGLLQGPVSSILIEVETNRVALEEIRQALRDPAPDSGSHTGLLQGPVSSILIASRSAAQWL